MFAGCCAIASAIAAAFFFCRFDADIFRLLLPLPMMLRYILLLLLRAMPRLRFYVIIILFHTLRCYATPLLIISMRAAMMRC